MQTEQQGTDLLTTFDDHLVRAGAGQRFANYIIDIIIFYLLAFGIGIGIALISPEALDAFANDDSVDIGGSLLTFFLYGIYMGTVEAIFKGKSLGKLITGTRAVMLDGSPISASKAFGRGFSRAVPFCVFSALGTPCNPWQDKWTDTMVIDEKNSAVQ